MYFKRPSFKKGGSTGIGQLTPRTQARGGGNIGGGIIAGSNLGSRTGFSVLDIISGSMAEELTGGSNKISSKADALKKSNVGLKKGNIGSRLLTQLRNLSIPSASTTGLMSLPFVPSAALAYMNRPKTLAEKKVMQDYGMLDETFGVAEDYEKYDADRKKARGIGEEISFTDALLMDPETGKYPRLFGRTEDRDPVTKRDDDFEMPRGGGADFAEIAETVIADKKEDTPIKTDDDTPKEPSFEDTYEAEKKKLEKLLGDDDDRGMAAIALSEAIGTPGTIADKAAVLNKSLLGIMQGKKKDRKDIAKLAYTATKEIEKAKIVADKEGFSEKQLNKMRQLREIVTDTTGTFTKEQKASAQAKLIIEQQLMNDISGKSNTTKVMSSDKARAELKTFEKVAEKLSKMDKTSPEYAKDYNSYIAQIELLMNYPELVPSIRRLDALYVKALAENKKDGGRIGFANGTPMEESIQVSKTVGQGQVPTAQTPELSFEEIRNRLPKEITDEIVRLIAGSNEALQDFSYIRTQGDVDKFNMKYGVTLVLPQSTA